MTRKFDFEIASRYEALGIPYPGDDSCPAECEGTGWVPIYMSKGDTIESSSARLEDEISKVYIDLWEDAEAKNPTDDGWHFVVCPVCHGTGKRA